MLSRPLSERRQGPKTCSPGDSVGDLVYPIDGETVTRIGVGARATMPATGIIISKIDATHCIVQFSGEIAGVFTGMFPGRVAFAGADGRPTDLPPSPSLGMPRIYLQAIGVALSDDVLQLRLSPELMVLVL